MSRIGNKRSSDQFVQQSDPRCDCFEDFSHLLLFSNLSITIFVGSRNWNRLEKPFPSCVRRKGCVVICVVCCDVVTGEIHWERSQSVLHPCNRNNVEVKSKKMWSFVRGLPCELFGRRRQSFCRAPSDQTVHSGLSHRVRAGGTTHERIVLRRNSI